MVVMGSYQKVMMKIVTRRTVSQRIILSRRPTLRKKNIITIMFAKVMARIITTISIIAMAAR